MLAGGFGLIWLCVQGLSIGIRGWQFPRWEALFGPLGDRQFGMGYGAMLYFASCLFMFSIGIAEQGTTGDNSLSG